MQRYGFLILTNLAVVFVLGIALTILQNQLGLELDNIVVLLIFSFAFGMGGAFISLALSKKMALRSVGGQVIEQPRNQTEQWLLGTVQRHAAAAGIGTPQLAVYQADHLNAFATGAKRNDALVAVSTGLVNRMQPHEVEAVIGHEITHVANGDMVTLTLVQGVLNTFVLFLSRVVGSFIDRAVFNSRGHGPGYWISVIVLQFLFGILATMMVMWFSRRREFRADRGGAELTSTGDMTAALARLGAPSDAELPEQLAALGIAGSTPTGIRRLFMSHPPIEERIEALQVPA